MRHTRGLEELRRHLVEDHHQTTVSMYLKEVVFGGVDGIVTTFAVVAGFSGASLANETTTQLTFVVVLLFGLANLFADGVSMGLGNFLAVRSDQSLYCKIRDKERQEIEEDLDREIRETITILMMKGFSEEDAKTLTTLYQKNESYWLDFMMSQELQIPDPTDDNPISTGFATFLAFICFGLVPLMPFIFFRGLDPRSAFELACVGTFVALLLLGVLRWRVIRTNLFKSVGEIVLVGSVAAAVAFLVGSLFTI